jgi:sugar lactone lactonase YvrE
MQAQSIVATKDGLDESALWSAKSGEVMWVDGTAPAIHRFNPETGV